MDGREFPSFIGCAKNKVECGNVITWGFLVLLFLFLALQLLWSDPFPDPTHRRNLVHRVFPFLFEFFFIGQIT